MSTLRVDKINLNDAGNAYFTIANSWNISMYVNNTEVVTYYSNNSVIYPTSTLIVNGSNVVSKLNDVGAAFNKANTSNITADLAYNKANTSVQNNTTTLITSGYTVTPYNAGVNIASFGTWTPDAANSNYQYGTTNGAVTIAVPAANCAVDFLLTNDSAAGSITWSGYTVQSGGTGDTYATTNTNKYLFSIRKINNIATYLIKALQ